MAGFTVDASEALRLAAEIARRREALLPKLNAATTKAARQIRGLSEMNAPSGPHTAKFGKSFKVVATQTLNGTKATIEAKGKVGKIGTILIYGTPTSGPHDSPGAALERVLPFWERAISDAAAEVI